MSTYFGLLDDFAVRHHDAAVTSMRALNEHLLTAVLFEGPLLINDGYLLNHAVLQEAVLKPDASPLRALVESGYIQILTRNGRGLATLAERMADDGVASAQHLLTTEIYRKQLKPALSTWGERLELFDFEVPFRDWPKMHLSQIFTKLATDALDGAVEMSAAGQDRKQLVEFQKVLHHGGSSANRTYWEKEVDRLNADAKISDEVRTALMLMGNEVYQYAWGCALSEEDDRAAVQTRAPMYLDLDVPLGRLDPEGQHHGVTVFGPDLGVAGKRIGSRWSLLAKVVRGNEEIAAVKGQFLTELNRYHADPIAGDEQVTGAAKQYSKALSAHFGSSRRAFRLDVTTTFLSGGVGLAVGGPVGAAVGIGVGLVGNVADATVGPKLMAKMSSPLSKPWITTKPGRMPVATSNFKLDQQKAAGYLEGVERFNR
jgi:hypothetical protein